MNIQASTQPAINCDHLREDLATSIRDAMERLTEFQATRESKIAEDQYYWWDAEVLKMSLWNLHQHLFGLEFTPREQHLFGAAIEASKCAEKKYKQEPKSQEEMRHFETQEMRKKGRWEMDKMAGDIMLKMRDLEWAQEKLEDRIEDPIYYQ